MKAVNLNDGTVVIRSKRNIYATMTVAEWAEIQSLTDQPFEIARGSDWRKGLAQLKMDRAGQVMADELNRNPQTLTAQGHGENFADVYGEDDWAEMSDAERQNIITDDRERAERTLEYTPSEGQIVVAIYNQNCALAGQERFSKKGRWDGYDYPLGDVTFYKGTPEEVIAEGRDLITRGDTLGGGNGSFLRRCGYTLIEAAGGDTDERE